MQNLQNEFVKKTWRSLYSYASIVCNNNYCCRIPVFDWRTASRYFYRAMGTYASWIINFI